MYFSCVNCVGCVGYQHRCVILKKTAFFLYQRCGPTRTCLFSTKALIFWVISHELFLFLILSVWGSFQKQKMTSHTEDLATLESKSDDSLIVWVLLMLFSHECS